MTRLRELLRDLPAYRMLSALRRRSRLERDAAFYRRLLPRDPLVFDLGANVGDVAEPLLRAGARVVAVEPQPECVAELAARLGDHPGLRVVRAVVGAAEGVATLYRHGYHASSSLRADWFGPPTGSLSVPMTTLRALIGAHGTPDYCKVDVEGSEPEVFSTLDVPLPLVSFEYVADGMDRVTTCLGRLSRPGSEVNVGLTGPHRFAFERWMAPAELVEGLPGWIRSGRLPRWGDVWIRTPIAG